MFYNLEAILKYPIEFVPSLMFSIYIGCLGQGGKLIAAKPEPCLCISFANREYSDQTCKANTSRYIFKYHVSAGIYLHC